MLSYSLQLAIKATQKEAGDCMLPKVVPITVFGMYVDRYKAHTCYVLMLKCPALSNVHSRIYMCTMYAYSHTYVCTVSAKSMHVPLECYTRRRK